MIGTQKMKKLTIIFISLLLFVSCVSNTENKKEEKPSINNVIDAIKSITLPKL
jgi:PBP1b-binding outer membrane lipoprotein LpoB